MRYRSRPSISPEHWRMCCERQAAPEEMYPGAGRTHGECCGTALLASLDQPLRDREGRGAPTPPWRPRLLCAALHDGQVICVEGAVFLGSWAMMSRVGGERWRNVTLSAFPLPASRA